MRPPSSPNSPSRAPLLLALALILCAGGCLRLFNLNGLPPGLWFDEALNGQDAAAVWSGPEGFRLVYPDVFPREPLFETLLALAVGVGGPRVPVLRVTSAAVGLLTIILLWAMLRREAGETAALAAAGVLATLFWHVLFSRLVFRTIVLGPWLVGLVWAVLACRRRPTAWRFVLVGGLIGGGFYTYLTWYFMLPGVAGLVAWLIWTVSPRGERLRRAGVVVGCALIVFLPLGLHYARHPEHLLARPAQVSIFRDGMGPGLTEILQNTGEAFLMFHWSGDHVPTQNIPRRSALDPIQGLFFLYGLVLCLARLRRREPLAAILLGWTGCGLLATVLTRTDSPNFLRTLCITPAVAAIVALGLADMARRLGRRWRPNLAAGLVVILILASGVWTAFELRAWGQRPDVWARYHAPLAQLAAHARETPPEVAVFVPEDYWSPRTFQFLTLGRQNVFPYKGRAVLGPWPPTPETIGRPRPRSRRVILAGEGDTMSAIRAGEVEGRFAKEFKDPAGRTWAVVFRTMDEE